MNLLCRAVVSFGVRVSSRGHIFLARGWLLYDGSVAATSSHAHHAFQAILTSEPALELASRRTDIELIPPDALSLRLERAA